MLAPVLARLESIAGVAESRVDSSGRFFWLTLEKGAEATRVTALAEDALGHGARLLPAGEAESQLAAHRRGDPWLRATEVMSLSYLESRLLSVRIASEVERRTGATLEEREAIADATRLELFAAMERVHGEGGRRSSGWIYQEWPAISAAVAERCARSLSPALRLSLGELLPILLAR